jgi:predicted phage-related endonuclease
MTSFDTESRRKAIWATDARKIVDGRAADVYLEKIGATEREDISHIEAVQWGLKLQDVIGREASARLQIELKEADYELYHPEHTWMASHFDFISADGTTLVEVKNYNQSKRNQYDAETGLMPAADRAQVVHEATVHRVQRCILAVLFGGQELVLIDKEISDDEKDALIRTEAELWGAIQAKQPPEPTSVDAAKKLFPVSTSRSLMADATVERQCAYLAAIKSEIKKLEDREAELQTAIQKMMRDSEALVTFDGRVLATWKSAKASKRFSADLLKAEMPEVYERYIVEQPGSRRFLVK